jgi:hypothetical protein
LIFPYLEVISKVIRNKNKEQNHSPVKGSFEVATWEVTASERSFCRAKGVPLTTFEEF